MQHQKDDGDDDGKIVAPPVAVDGGDDHRDISSRKNVTSQNEAVGSCRTEERKKIEILCNQLRLVVIVFPMVR